MPEHTSFTPYPVTHVAFGVLYYSMQRSVIDTLASNWSLMTGHSGRGGGAGWPEEACQGGPRWLPGCKDVTWILFWINAGLFSQCLIYPIGLALQAAIQHWFNIGLFSQHLSKIGLFSKCCLMSGQRLQKLGQHWPSLGCLWCLVHKDSFWMTNSGQVTTFTHR